MDRTEVNIETICKRVREALAHESAANVEPREERAAFLEAFARRRAGSTIVRSLRQRRLRWLPLALATSLAAGAAGVWLWTRPVSFQVGEARSGQLGDVIEAAGQPTSLYFSEGSRLLLHAGGRLRVLSLERETARVLVENGRLDVSIAHKQARKTRWSFEAGPYRVAVTGTKFQMAFYARDRSFSLSTQEGQVVVSGGCQQTLQKVSAGERIDLSCPDSQALPPAREDGLAQRPEEPRPELLPDAVPSTAGAAAGEPAWRRHLASGRFVEGLRAAERTDFQRVCQVATARELLALADAARLFGPRARAIAALRTLRQRFPGTMDAGTAAFKLGLVAFEKDHAYAEAARWFETCLREQPSGPLMGDSVGRLMEARLRGGDLSGARSDAQQYLRRFPEGPYASEARGILSR
jgi:TolA-binding protein